MINGHRQMLAGTGTAGAGWSWNAFGASFSRTGSADALDVTRAAAELSGVE
jgi:hypothetical protein